MRKVCLTKTSVQCADEKKFLAYLKSGFQFVETDERLVTLLGVKPEDPEVAYGWIEPGVPMLRSGRYVLYRVRRFWEKPSLAMARVLMSTGCLWNSFVMAGDMIIRATPWLYRTAAKVLIEALPQLTPRFAFSFRREVFKVVFVQDHSAVFESETARQL